MDRPIYTGNRRKNVRWRQIFIIVIILQLVLLSLYLYNRSIKLNKKPTDNSIDKVNDNLPLEAIAKEKNNKSFNKISEKELASIKKLFDSGNYEEAYNSIQPLLSKGDENVINLLGQINMRRLLSSQPMQDKIFYVVKSGDYLQKIANEFNLSNLCLYASAIIIGTNAFLWTLIFGSAHISVTSLFGKLVHFIVFTSLSKFVRMSLFQI